MLLPPLLTEQDLEASSEGSLDPLGLSSVADALGTRLAPGVRERQRHPRFLTAMAVSFWVCKDFGEDAVAADGVSEPWQVFEWHLVEGLVRRNPVRDELRGLPGHTKVAQAIRDGVPLCARRYLKTPSVFGFHGVYRTLARELDIETAGRLGENGNDLLTTWADEQNLEGFCGSSGGPGRQWCERIKEAVGDGLKKGAVARTGGWEGWGFFSAYLAHRDIPRNEGRLLWRDLTSPAAGFRKEVFEFLVSPEGKRAWAGDGEASERRFHTSLREHGSPELRHVLDTIMAYEAFARLLQDAFDACLLRMTKTRGRTAPAEIARLPGVGRAFRGLRPLFEELVDKLAGYGRSGDFQEDFRPLAEPTNLETWVDLLLELHRKTQRRKPPNGKAPWFERFDDGTLMIRPKYRLENGGPHADGYVHAYRTRALWDFASDLGRV